MSPVLYIMYSHCLWLSSLSLLYRDIYMCIYLVRNIKEGGRPFSVYKYAYHVMYGTLLLYLLPGPKTTWQMLRNVPEMVTLATLHLARGLEGQAINAKNCKNPSK